MSATVGSLIDYGTWSDGKRMHVIGTLAFSGSYTTGGETLDFGAGGVQTSQPPLIILFPFLAGYQIQYVPGTDASDGKIKIYRGATASVAATVTITSDTTNTFSDGETITLGTKVYTLKTALTVPAVANEILIAGSVTAMLDNIKAAVNAGTGAGTTYGTGTVANPDLTAGTKTGTTILFTANVAGTAGNSLASTETVAHLSFGATTLTGGVDATSGSTEIAGSTYPTDISSASPKFYAIFAQLL